MFRWPLKKCCEEEEEVEEEVKEGKHLYSACGRMASLHQRNPVRKADSLDRKAVGLRWAVQTRHAAFCRSVGWARGERPGWVRSETTEFIYFEKRALLSDSVRVFLCTDHVIKRCGCSTIMVGTELFLLC